MIELTRLNRAPVIINADLIEHIDANPDTVVSLTTGQKFMVLEPAHEVMHRAILYRRSIVARTAAVCETAAGMES